MAGRKVENERMLLLASFSFYSAKALDMPLCTKVKKNLFSRVFVTDVGGRGIQL